MPAPEPTGLYWSEYPYAEPRAGVQTETSGDTNELPAPVIVVSFGVASAAVAATNAAARAANVSVSFLVMAADCRACHSVWADAVLPARDKLVTAQRDCSLRRERSSRKRAVRLVTSTKAISTKASAHACWCSDSSGASEYWKIVNGIELTECVGFQSIVCPASAHVK